jgi:hypothetical protein
MQKKVHREAVVSLWFSDLLSCISRIPPDSDSSRSPRVGHPIDGMGGAALFDENKRSFSFEIGKGNIQTFSDGACRDLDGFLFC